MKRPARVLRQHACFAALATVLAFPAFAQDSAPQSDRADASDEAIVVTGSRIASGFDRPTPVAVLGAERLETRGITNLGDALNELPAFRATNSPASTGLGAAGGYVGGRILDLRGLGAVRTLTLVDGKRFVPSTTQATVDTNMIPSIMLQRAEVVTGGASAVYGSDAVSGVVNLLIDKAFTGYKANAQVGFSQYGDNFTTQFGAAGGWQIGETLHLLVGGEYEKAEGVESCPSRDWCANGFINISRNPGVTSLPANNILAGVYPWTAPYNGITTPPSSAYAGRLVPALRAIDGIGFRADGTPFRTTQGTLANNLYQLGGTNDGPGENIYFDFPIVSPTKRYNAMAFATWEATPALTMEFGFNYGHGEGRHRAVPYRNTAITIQRDNPFIPTSSNPALDLRTIMDANGLTSFTLGKGFKDVGPGQLVVKNDVYRAVASAKYEISPNWSADIYYQFGRNEFRSDITGGTITSRILKALDAVAGPGGAPVCRVNADASTTNNDPACVALNPFGSGQGATFAAAKAYVTADAFQTNITTQHVVAANVTGSLFDLPAGPLGVAVGAEYRSDSVSGDADANSKALAFFTGNGSVISGKIQVVEAYGEAEVPILRDTTFFRELSLNGAVRRTHYKRSSDFFPSSTVNVTTWKVGGVWAPVDAVRFRVTKSRDIRAPNVSELFGPITSASGILNDPARGGQQTVVPITLGSNPNLRPEKADTFTAGIVLQPSGGMLGRFRASVDYYDIKIKDAISTLGQQNIVTRCSQGDTLSCSLVTRDGGAANGVITNVRDVVQNVNQLNARGIDMELNYRQPVGAASAVNLSVMASHVIDLVTVDAVGPVERAGQTGLRGGTPPGIPDWTVDATVGLDLGELFSLSTHVRWINKGFYNAAFIGAEQPGYVITASSSSSTNAMPSRTYVDMMGTVKVPVGGDNKLSVYFGVDNVFNVDPPNFPGANGSGNNVLFNPVGRMYKAGIRTSF
ncbi:outer membrane receptor protein involved in Fe transport [Sphingobium sp. B7D2B]|uniref:TonB-dependent receptor domain-containing protein n=1 Tax=Sphingobium sp. B7D2B TaxID=2940583 RepID=UPI002225AADD|nr:TonB-dependent receptor [Sphingobium sp. B7D2B]MCW2365276.1 outer membrane receptor protein involved in Fe transport [Sphingobium sp. B7D2B]